MERKVPLSHSQSEEAKGLPKQGVEQALASAPQSSSVKAKGQVGRSFWLWVKKPDVLATIVALVAFFAAFFLMWLWYEFVRPAETTGEVDCGDGLVVVLHYPGSVAVADENYLSVKVMNRGTEPITGTVAVEFSDSWQVELVEGESNEIEFASLEPGIELTKRLAFRLPGRRELVVLRALVTRIVALKLQIWLPHKGTYCGPTDGWAIRLAPFYRMRDFSWGSVIMFFVSLFSNRLVKLLGFEESTERKG